MGQTIERLRELLKAEASVSEDTRIEIELLVGEVVRRAFREGYEEGAFIDLETAEADDPHHERLKDMWDMSTAKATIWG